MIQYHLPGIHVTEREFDVPLVWSSPEEEKVRLFVRELVDPVRVTEDLPLVTFLQGGPGGANPRPIERSGWIDEALKHYRIIMVDQRGTGRSSPLDARIVAARAPLEQTSLHTSAPIQLLGTWRQSVRGSTEGAGGPQ